METQRDGHITSVKLPFLRVFLDDGYPDVVAEAKAALAAVVTSPST